MKAMAKRNRIRAGKGLSEVLVTFTRRPRAGGTTYRAAAWWGIGPEGYPLAGPCSSERKLRAEVAALRRYIASREYAPR